MAYEQKIFITIDVDWANDLVFSYTADLLEQRGIKATVFATHKTPVLDRLKSNSNVEIGLHPNYRPLLLEKNNPDNIESIFKRAKILAPDAVSVRNHCLICGFDIWNLYAAEGISHLSNLLMPFISGMALKPFKVINNLNIVPFGWEDDVHCSQLASGLVSCWSPDIMFRAGGLKVFNFHPHHLYLNTENLLRIDSRCKHLLRSDSVGEDELNSYINPSQEKGVKVFFDNLIALANAEGFGFGLIREIEVG